MIGTYDIIIVGAGPAGATAAIAASQRGLRTLLLDRSSFPRDKVCGDAVSTKACQVLEGLGVITDVRKLNGARINRVIFGSPDGTRASIDLGVRRGSVPADDFVIRRRDFDNLLFQHAQQAGATCVERFKVKDLLLENDVVQGVIGDDSAGKITTHRARIVIGADGYPSTVARQAGLTEPWPKHRLVALRQYHRGVDGLTDQLEVHFVDGLLPGYFWLFPLTGNQANVGIGVLFSEVRRRRLDLKAALRTTISSPIFRDRFANATPLEQPVGWNLPVGSIRRPCSRAGLLLAGDAAGLVDPFTGEGIGNALISAVTAIDVVAEALNGNDVSASTLRRYDQRLWRALGAELRVSSNLQRVARSKRLLNLVVRRAHSSTEIADLIAGMIVNQIPRSRLVDPLFYLRLIWS